MHFNQLTPAELERLSILSEECEEVVLTIGKILRHGLDNSNPEVQNAPTNRQMLEKEVADVAVAIQMLMEAGDLNADACNLHRELKKESIKKYLRHQPQ